MNTQVPENAEQRLVLRPENLQSFRCGRLLLLLDVIRSLALRKPADIERLAFYDFFAANPFLAVADDDESSRKLSILGFSSYDLSYQSSSHRFADRRAALKDDLTLLLGYGAVSAGLESRRVIYSVTDIGEQLVSQLRSLYADAYRQSATIVVGRLDRLSDRALRESSWTWLSKERALVDLRDPREEMSA